MEVFNATVFLDPPLSLLSVCWGEQVPSGEQKMGFLGDGCEPPDLGSEN